MGEETTVRQLMREIIAVDERASAVEAARMMTSRRISSLVVCRNESPVGLVTERDLMSKVVAEAANPTKIMVGEVMAAPPITIDAAASVVDAARKMSEKGIKKLVVSDNGVIVGIISQTDIVREVADFKMMIKLGAV